MKTIRRSSTSIVIGIFLISLLCAACTSSTTAAPTAREPESPTLTKTSPTLPSPSSTTKPMDIASPDPTIKPTTIVSPTKIENTVEETTLNGEELLKRRCTECHGLNYITTESMDAEGWTSTVQRMLDKGAYLSEAEQKVLIEYLATTYP